MNKILLTSICSLTVSVPSGFLIYYLSGSSEPTPAPQYELSELSVSQNGDQYLIGKITSDINNNVEKLTNPLKFTCEISKPKSCTVKVLNREELIKQDKLNFNTIQDLFVDAKQEQLTKGTYVQVNFNNEHGVEQTTKTETITIDNTGDTFIVEWENKKNENFTINQKEFVTKTITQPQEAYDVDNERYCLIKMPNDDSIFYQNAWLFPRNKEDQKGFEWRIGTWRGMNIKQKIELYEIEDQNQENKHDVLQNKKYFDTQNKFIQTVDALKNQQNKWVKMVIQNKNINCRLSVIIFTKDGSEVLEYFADKDIPLPNHELKDKTLKK